MKLTILSLACVFYLNNSKAQKNSIWEIKEFGTNYVSKGPKDVFELPNKKGIINTCVQIINDTLVFVTKDKRELFCSDTLILKKKFILKKQKNNKLNLLYPGDELSCINENKGTDSCYVSQSFMNLLGVKSNVLQGYNLATIKGQAVSCMLFLIQDNKQMAFFSANEFLILKLYYLKKYVPIDKKKSNR